MLILSLLQDHFRETVSTAIVGKVSSLTFLCGVEEGIWKKEKTWLDFLIKTSKIVMFLKVSAFYDIVHQSSTKCL